MFAPLMAETFEPLRVFCPSDLSERLVCGIVHILSTHLIGFNRAGKVMVCSSALLGGWLSGRGRPGQSTRWPLSGGQINFTATTTRKSTVPFRPF
ncbi:hypothetical protein I7I48_03468 [Histoplasma ohiense]|nr:hypothetical protein I7I48_03468 [Histoplasma ohiense (nom. inval.)]